MKVVYYNAVTGEIYSSAEINHEGVLLNDLDNGWPYLEFEPVAYADRMHCSLYYVDIPTMEIRPKVPVE